MTSINVEVNQMESTCHPSGSQASLQIMREREPRERTQAFIFHYIARPFSRRIEDPCKNHLV